MPQQIKRHVVRVLALAAVCVTPGCGSAPDGGSTQERAASVASPDSEPTPDPVTQPRPADASALLKISGVVAWDDRGCFTVDGQFVVLPHGTTFSPDGATLVLPTGETFEQGSEIAGTGGASEAEPASEQVARGCVDEVGEEHLVMDLVGKSMW